MTVPAAPARTSIRAGDVVRVAGEDLLVLRVGRGLVRSAVVYSRATSADGVLLAGAPPPRWGSGRFPARRPLLALPPLELGPH